MMSAPASPIRRFALVALLCTASLAGCDESRIIGPVAETEDANFQDGKRLAGEGKDREALEAFTKVILSRRDAPEAHLEAGNLCLNTQVKDPLQAIFHYRRYLALRPGAVQVQYAVVQQQIRRAEKEYLRTLPFRPPEGVASDKSAEYLEQLKIVRAENDVLKQKLGAALAAASRPAPLPVSARISDEDDASDAPVPTTPSFGGTSGSGTPAVARPSRRTHTIAKGDTLVIISRKYYGTPNRWKDILNANSRVMKSERDMKIGRILELPE